VTSDGVKVEPTNGTGLLWSGANAKIRVCAPVPCVTATTRNVTSFFPLASWIVNGSTWKRHCPGATT